MQTPSELNYIKRLNKNENFHLKQNSNITAFLLETEGKKEIISCRIIIPKAGT